MGLAPGACSPLFHCRHLLVLVQHQLNSFITMIEMNLGLFVNSYLTHTRFLFGHCELECGADDKGKGAIIRMSERAYELAESRVSGKGLH